MQPAVHHHSRWHQFAGSPLPVTWYHHCSKTVAADNKHTQDCLVVKKTELISFLQCTQNWLLFVLRQWHCQPYFTKYVLQMAGGAMTRALDSKGNKFDSQSLRYQQTTSAKLFTHKCLCHHMTRQQSESQWVWQWTSHASQTQMVDSMNHINPAPHIFTGRITKGFLLFHLNEQQIKNLQIPSRDPVMTPDLSVGRGNFFTLLMRRRISRAVNPHTSVLRARPPRPRPRTCCCLPINQ